MENILNELLQNGELIRPAQLEFVRSVDKYYKRTGQISDKQYFILKEIRGDLNKKCIVEVTMLISEKFPDSEKIIKKPAWQGGAINDKGGNCSDKDKEKF
jgi:hypothetical protein